MVVGKGGAPPPPPTFVLGRHLSSVAGATAAFGGNGNGNGNGSVSGASPEKGAHNGGDNGGGAAAKALAAAAQSAAASAAAAVGAGPYDPLIPHRLLQVRKSKTRQSGGVILVEIDKRLPIYSRTNARPRDSCDC